MGCRGNYSPVETELGGAAEEQHRILSGWILEGFLVERDGFLAETTQLFMGVVPAPASEILCSSRSGAVIAKLLRRSVAG